jgi:hypothetical protein
MFVSAIGVVGVCMGDDRVFHRLPRVDIKIALPAIKPSLGKSYQPLFRHKPILQQRGVFNVQVFRIVQFVQGVQGVQSVQWRSICVFLKIFPCFMNKMLDHR